MIINLIRPGDRIRLDKDCSLFNCPFAADGNLFAGTTDIHTYTRNRTHQSYYAIIAAAGLKIRVVANWISRKDMCSSLFIDFRMLSLEWNQII